MKIITMLPFLDEQSKDEIVESILNHELEDSKLLTPALYPFLNKTQMKKLYEAALEKKIDADPYIMLPFVGQEALNDVISRIESGELKDIRIERMLPFLSHEHIRKIFKQAFHQYKKSPPKEDTSKTEDKEEAPSESVQESKE